MIKIIDMKVDDVRFPTSEDLTGSDAIHTDPDYSATYVTIITSDNDLKGHGIAPLVAYLSNSPFRCPKFFAGNNCGCYCPISTCSNFSFL